MDKEVSVKELDCSTHQIARFCRVSSSVLLFLSACFVLPVIAALFMFIGLPFGLDCLSYSGPMCSVIILTIQYILFALCLWLLHRVFNDISQKRPFSQKQSRRLLRIGLLSLVYSIIEIVPFSPVSIDLFLGPLYLGLQLVHHQPANLNMGTILCAISFISLSAVFQYGSLLQRISDDTV